MWKGRATPFTGLGFGLLFVIWGLPMVFRFLKRDRVPLVTCKCPSCGYQWNRLGGDGDGSVLQPVLESFEHKNNVVRQKAASALANIKDSRAIEPLIEALEDEGKDVRKTAAYALGQIGDSQAVEPLKGALDDTEVQVVMETVLPIAKFNDPAAVDCLLMALQDNKPAIRRTAAESLGSFGDVKMIEPPRRL